MRGINLSSRSDKPIYQQLYEQLCSQILNRELEKDFSLPPIRTVAKELRISIITVKKAWEELERSGLIYSIAGKGCFISDLSNVELINKRNGIIRSQMVKDIRFYKNLGIELEEIVELIKMYYNDSQK